jgi:hypothetical protein
MASAGGYWSKETDMLTGLIAFLTSNVARMLWGEVSALWKEAKDHGRELERMRLADELEAKAHARNMESVRLQAELGQREIVLKSEAAVDEIEARAWLSSVEVTGKTTGIAFIDIWNGVIRPAGATWAFVMITAHYLEWLKLDENGWMLCGAFLGLFVASRDLFKRGRG